MKYFELFNIPVQLKVKEEGLHQKFIQLSRKFHPDYFINSPEDVQAEALENSALVNRAYKTFRNPDETIKYVLKEKEMLEEEEKYELPPSFLMEVLEINEQLMDAGVDTAGRLTPVIENLQIEIYAPVKEIVENYQEGITTREELLQVKEYYYKKKYLDRIRQQLTGIV